MKTQHHEEYLVFSTSLSITLTPNGIVMSDIPGDPGSQLPTALSGVPPLLPDSCLSGISHFPDPDPGRIGIGVGFPLCLSFAVCPPTKRNANGLGSGHISLSSSYSSYTHMDAILRFFCDCDVAVSSALEPACSVASVRNTVKTI